MEERLDYIIVGSGLAGMVMAQTLHRHHCSFKILAQPALSKCSAIAAGILNPVVFFRITKSYMAGQALPFAETFYTEQEKLLQKKIFARMPIAKIFSTSTEKELWEKRREEGVGHYLGAVEQDLSAYPEIIAPHGIGFVKQSGFLDCAEYLEASMQFFKEHFVTEVFDHNAVSFQAEDLTYKNIRATGIIFCEGYLGSQNPFFTKIIYRPVKGETLTVEFEKPFTPYLQELILSRKSYLLPLGNNRYKVGATYNWEELNEETTEAAKTELTQAIQSISPVPFRILSHQAGIRPAIADRRLVIGRHKEYDSLAIFNGLGTKGAMLAPYFAELLFRHLHHGETIPKDVDLKRFEK